MSDTTNNNYKIIEVSKEDNNQRLDKWLAKSFNNINTSIAQKLIRTGQIKVDGKKVKYNHVLLEGQSVRVPTDSISNINLDKKIVKTIDPLKYKNEIQKLVDAVIYKDDNLVILNKPSGVPVQGGSKVTFNVTVAFADLRFGLENNPFIVHRIDKETSGILILARNKQAAQYMFDVFKEKKITKTYICLVHPFIAKKYNNIGFEGRISAPLLKAGNINMEGIVIDEQGKEAISDYKVLDYKNNIGLMEVKPLTGRTHQIRVHMSEYLGNPIIGDFKYGATPLKEKNFNHRKMYLHAQKIEFISVEGKEISITAPFDSDFKGALEEFGFNN